jgi:hypothetical protein
MSIGFQTFPLYGLLNPHVYKESTVNLLVLQMQCFPLYSLLLSMGNPKVNLLVLDVEGAETLVLKTVPWAKVDIEVKIRPNF